MLEFVIISNWVEFYWIRESIISDSVTIELTPSCIVEEFTSGQKSIH